jgi:bifunctional UDP-N-acetylglucosamine pyrophosphorylase/glucosamine-1-phosphate N-acetyltransferase
MDFGFIMKAVIMAAGEGTRLKPLTNTRPKVMLPVAGKPIIYHLLREAKKAGIKEAIIIVRHMKEKIIEYLAVEEKTLGLRIIFIEQQEGYGTASAILAAEKYVNDTFVVLAGDTVTEASVIKSVIKAHDGSITLAVKEVENPHNYGAVELSGGIVRSFEEKPKHPKSNLVNLSVYCMEPAVFNEIRAIPKSERGEYEIVNLFIGKKAVKVDGFWMDIAYPWHLLDANDYLLSKMKAKRGSIENSKIKGKVIMERGASIINSVIEGNVYIGENSVIGPNAYIRGSTSIGKGCSVGGASTVKNSILFDRVNAKHLSYIGDSIIGEEVNFGAATQIANYRFDSSSINVLTEKGWVNSGRNKFGTVVGDNTKFGVLSCTMPGKLIGENCWISSGVTVNKNVPPNTRVYVKQELHFAAAEEGGE